MSFSKLKAWLASSVITLGTAALVFGFSHSCLYARQDPSRQLVQTNEQRSSSNRRIALVIGNGAYTSAPPLKNPPNDARDMATTLKGLGFDVATGINVSQRDMKRLIREFGLKLKGGGSGLFYYAGHGVQSKGRNYLIPVDAVIQSEAEVEDSGVDAALILNFMDDAQNGLNIIILDACRNNPFARSFRSANDGLAQVDAPTGTLIAYATAPGRVASDGTEQNGLYTSELLKQMRVPGLSVTDMFMRVRGEVMKQTGNKQVPWEASSLVGSFFFVGNSGVTGSSANEATAVKIDPSAFELTYWDTIKSSQNVDDFKSYLEKYPEGQFASLAKNRIASLQPPTKTVGSLSPANTGATELAFWDSIKNSTSADDYRAYLEKYPNGEFAGLAKRRLTPLEAAEKEKTKTDDVARVDQPASLDPNAKVFIGYMGVMSAGFTARPGKLVIAAAGMQFIWDKGTQGIAEGRTDGLTGSKPGAFPLHPDPLPASLQCSYFTAARNDGFFIREINFNDGEAMLNVGIGGAVARFRASSPAEAITALAAVREFCNKRP